MGETNNGLSTEALVEAYLASDDSLKSVVDSILQGDKYIMAVFSGKASSGKFMVDVGWKADQSVSTVLLETLVQIGKKHFGEVWLNGLKTQLNL